MVATSHPLASEAPRWLVFFLEVSKVFVRFSQVFEGFLMVVQSFLKALRAFQVFPSGLWDFRNF